MHKSKTQTKHTKTQEQQCARTQTPALTHTIMHALTHSSRAPKHRERARESKRNILAHFVYLQRTQIVTAQGESEWNSPQPQTVCNNWPLPPLSGWLSHSCSVLTLALSLSPNVAASFGHALHLLQFAFAAATAAAAVFHSFLPKIPFNIDYWFSLSPLSHSLVPHRWPLAPCNR